MKSKDTFIESDFQETYGYREEVKMIIYNSLRRFSAAIAIAFILSSTQIAAATPLENETDDVDISDAIFDELSNDQVIMAHWIDVICEDGVVTLSGRVGSVLAKERAALIAGTVRGTRAVVNLLDIVPPEPVSDKALEANIREAWVTDPATDSYELEVSASGGSVTISGEVDSWQEKRLSAMVAKGVNGVIKINNDITIQDSGPRSDSEIVNEIEQAIRWDALVDGALVQVTASNGRVTLSGIVGSLAEKRRIINHAFLAEAKVVYTEALRIDFNQRNPDLRGNKYLNLNDTEIRQAVGDVLFRDPRVAPYHLVVEVENGVVTLRGIVDNLKAKQAAFRSAQNTVGVSRVINRLRVRPEGVYLDAEIKHSVSRSLQRDPFIERERIVIAVHAGVVELNGSVNSSFERLRAEELAMRVNGVVGVNNHIAVNSAPIPYPYNPYVDDWYASQTPFPFEPGRLKTTKSDFEIILDIERELYWSPFVDSDTVHVEKVEDGVATLTGTFDLRSEFIAATKNAYDGGAIAVDNKLVYRDAEH